MTLKFVFGLLPTVLALYFLVTPSNGLKCIVCGYAEGVSESNEDCFDNPPVAVECPGNETVSDPTTFGNIAWNRGGSQARAINDTICFKTVGIYKDENFIARGCGIANRDDISQCENFESGVVNTADGDITVTDGTDCHCDKDNCNGSPSFGNTVFLTILAVITTSLIKQLSS